uniref:Uncharacterized protein n=1 Tax=Caenorhabditis japonica TaxID=281687 RepID=A0A8R1HZ28_CAEJA
MDELSLNGGPIGAADVRIMCETLLNEKRCARRENRSYCLFRVKHHGQCFTRMCSLSRIPLFNFPGTVTTALRNLEHAQTGEMKSEIANLIGIRRDPYLTSSAMLRSSSAMPRCMSSGYETGSSDADCQPLKTGGPFNTEEVMCLEPSTSSGIYRRDSEAAHKIVTARKISEQLAKKKRSASFLPSFRDIRHRLSNMKRTKSPSPERLTTGRAHESLKTTTTTATTDTSSFSSDEPQLMHRKKVARNESNTMSTGSNTSGRQSRSQQSRRGNTNAAPRGASKPTIAKLFDVEQGPIVSSGALRRLSASDQNAFAKHRMSNEQMSVTEFLISEHQREKDKLPKRNNTMVLSETAKAAKNTTNRRHTAPIHNNRLRRNRPNTIGAGLPHRNEPTSSSMEEKENQADCETDDALEKALEANQAKLLLEQKAMEARLRRAGRKQKGARNITSESMLVMNGSMVAGESSGLKLELNSVNEESSPRKVIEAFMEENKKQFCDMATSPMVLAETPKQKPTATHENGHVWVGTKQVITVTPSPSIVRRQSRARLSYSKATESPIDIALRPRESSPLMSPVLRHVTVTNNSPQAKIVTTSTPRSSLTPKSAHALSPLVLRSGPPPPPPPVPAHSPPHLTPQTSSTALEPTDELKRVSLTGEQQHQRRRPPTPPSHPKVANPFSPKLPVRAMTIDNGFELSQPLFKLPHLPKKISGGGGLSPLARQPQSLSTLSVPNRANLRETKSIDAVETPLRSAPASHRPHSSNSSQLSPRSAEFFEFGKYTTVLRSAKDEFALPNRKQSAEPRPSVAVIRSNNCGLVRSRVHQFQEIEQAHRNETSLSGRISAMSQISLRSSDTHPSSSDRLSDVSDSRHNLTSSESMDNTVLTPTVTSSSRTSYDPVHHF